VATWVPVSGQTREEERDSHPAEREQQGAHDGDTSHRMIEGLPRQELVRPR
jgi:hypothetical protein